MRRVLIPLLLIPANCAWAQTVTVPLPGKGQPPATTPSAADQPATVPLPGPGGSGWPAPKAPPGVPRALPPPPPINPYGRAIDLTVNVQYFDRDLGETVVHMAADGSTTVDAAGMTSALRPLLTDDGRAKVASAIGSRERIVPDDLHPLGIDFAFDRENVSIDVRSIDARLRLPVPLFGQPNNDAERAINANPADFSFFVDATVSESKIWNGPTPGWRDPAIYLNSAIRAGSIVLEGQGQFADRAPGQVNPQYQFDRNYVRLVYDMPEQYLRTYAGDLTPEIRFQQNYVQMGGVGLSRQKRRFDDFRTAILQGNRQLVLQRESTVDVYRNGVLYQQLQLGPGAYDLSNLPLLSGSNDVRIAVRDESGSSQTLNYQTYLDPIDLEPGDWEMGAYFGKLARQLGLSPKYNGDWAFTGFFRKAFIGHPAIGFGVQASREVQQLSAQTQFLVGSGGRLDVTAAGSRSPLGDGFLVGVSYDLALDKGARADTVNVQGIYQSRYFTGLGAPNLVNSSIFNGTATYTHTFGPDLSMQIGGSYARNRRPIGDDYRIYLDAYHRISRKWLVRGGVDYQHLGTLSSIPRRNGFGFSVGLVFQPTNDDRAEARYSYHLDEAELSYEHSPDGYVGSVGYGALLSRNADLVTGQGYANYLANRFNAGISHSISGTSFGGPNNRQVTTARLSTAIVFADGALALSRRVGDSFAILEPHASLKGHDVVVGQLLTDPRYRSKSGALGGAVSGSLPSYANQSVQYDVENPPPGYDIGTGIFRVRPPYHSGYRLVVGTEAYVTAMGTLVDATGKPLVLASGQLVNLTHATDKPSAFFTNSIGRFVFSGLRPNDRYRVQLYTGEKFEFAIPDKSAALLDLQAVKIGSGG